MYKKIIFLSIIILVLGFLSYKTKTPLNIKKVNKEIEVSCPIKENLFPIDSYSKTYANKENKLPPTIIVSHFSINNNFFMPVIKNHRSYAKKYGYDYWFRNGVIDNRFANPERPNNIVAFLGLYWQKLAAIKEAMNIMDKSENKHKYDWVMWIDGDAVFTNHNISLENLRNSINVTKQHYFILTKDMCCQKNNVCPYNCCINAGVMLIRNNNTSRQFIQNVIDSFPFYKEFVLPEQTAIQDQIFGLVERNNNKIKIKNYTGDNKCNSPTIAGIKIVESKVINSGYIRGITKWKNGDFIAHFSSISNSERNIKIPKFLSCINQKHNKNLAKCEHI